MLRKLFGAIVAACIVVALALATLTGWTTTHYVAQNIPQIATHYPQAAVTQYEPNIPSTSLYVPQPILDYLSTAHNAI